MTDDKIPNPLADPELQQEIAAAKAALAPSPTADRLLREAGVLLVGEANQVISKFIVQVWSTLNERWMDGAFSAVDTLPEALRLAAEEEPSERWPRARVVQRTVAIIESAPWTARST